jgi:hypothetical protein
LDGSKGESSVQQTANGGHIVAGNTWSLAVGSGDVYLIKVDANGNERWQRTFDGPEQEAAHSVDRVLPVRPRGRRFLPAGEIPRSRGDAVTRGRTFQRQRSVCAHQGRYREHTVSDAATLR